MKAHLPPGTRFRDIPHAPLMVVVPAGTFEMGSTDGAAMESPVHTVSLPHSFAIGVYPVTFDEWDHCYNSGGTRYHPSEAPRNPPVASGTWERGTRPVINVGWYDAQEYVNWLSASTGQRYRLPSESEWEYSARAGTSTPFTFGNTLSHQSIANCKDCGSEFDGRSTSPVGAFPANAFGLHDIHGNVWEWVQDSRNEQTYWGAPRNGDSWEDSETAFRMLRGGSWSDEANDIRSASRKWSTTDYRFDGGTLGFRVARDLTPEELGVSLAQMRRPLYDTDVPALAHDFDGLQAGILKSHGRGLSCLTMISLPTDASVGRLAVGVIARTVTSFSDQLDMTRTYKQTGDDNRCIVTMHLSGGAYKKLGLDTSSFSSAFLNGMISARERINDPSPETFDPPYRSHTDILLNIAGSRADLITTQLFAILDACGTHVNVLHVEWGLARRNERGDSIGPFGFVDGISNPEFFQPVSDNTHRARNWSSKATPGLVLVPDPLCAFRGLGSYLVFRKYYTSQSRFEQMAAIAQESIGNGCTLEHAKALFFGRFPDGSPLILNDQAAGGYPSNDFDYRADPDGTKCPFHAHIRKANPRGEHEGVKDRDRRIVRRGVPFHKGATWPGCEDFSLPSFDNVDDGLLFLAFQASIEDQFEFIQRVWLNDGDFLYGQFPGADPIVGAPGTREVDPSGTYVVDQEAHHRWPTVWGGSRSQRVNCDVQQVARLAGGQYYFTPSIYWLRSLCAHE